MGLKDLKLPTTTVEVPGGSITVRGLSLADIIVLARKYAPAMREVFARVSEGGLSGLDLSAAGGDVLAVAPDLAAEAIALCSGAPDSMELARNLPAPITIECLEAIGVLTVETSGGLKKVVETVIRVANGTTNAVTSLQKPLPNGSGASELG